VAPKKKTESELVLPSQVDPLIAEQLADQASADGVDLVGPDGLLGQLTKQVLEAGLEVEMDEHRGYPKHAPEGRDGANSRNETRSKTVITEIVPVEIDTPSDLDGSFEPATVRKRQRRLHGVDSMVIPLGAKGLTTGEIKAHLAEASFQSTEALSQKSQLHAGSPLRSRLFRDVAPAYNSPSPVKWVSYAHGSSWRTQPNRPPSR